MSEQFKYSNTLRHYANVTFVFYRTTISTVIPISDSIEDNGEIIREANRVIMEDWDIDSLDACQDWNIEISEF